jgi:hypothetical protein
MTRPPAIKPETAYDYRRAIVLIQVLAMDKSDGLKLTDLQALAVAWNVSTLGGFSLLLQRLAQAAIEYQRQDADHATD